MNTLLLEKLYTMFVRKDGSVWATGFNHFGQLGLGHTTDVSTPVEVTAIGKTVRSVSCGHSHTVFLQQDGRVWVTGLNNCGQLGLGHITNQTTPQMVDSLEQVVMTECYGDRCTLFFIA